MAAPAKRFVRKINVMIEERHDDLIREIIESSRSRITDSDVVRHALDLLEDEHKAKGKRKR